MRSGPRLLSWGLTLVAGWPLAARAESFDSDGVRIHYLIRGQGEPVILIHGLYSSARINWELPGLVDLLADKYRVIALDNRGHGLSDKPEAEDEYGLKMVRDVLGLMDHLGIERAHMVGYSMGGMILMKLLTIAPERVRSAVIGGMGWFREGSRLQQFWENVPERDRGLTPTACLRGLAELAITEEALRAIETPSVVLVGDRDPVRRLYVEPLLRIRRAWPVRIIPDAGHLDCITKPRFAAELRAFLDGQTAASREGDAENPTAANTDVPA